MNTAMLTNSVKSIEPEIVVFKLSVADWCRLRHQLTEKYTMGTSTNASSAT